MKKKIIIVVVIIILGGICGTGIYGYNYVSNLGGPLDAGSTDYTAIEIPMGSGVESIAKLLVDNKIINDVFEYKLWAKLNSKGTDYKAGKYHFSPNMSFEQISQVLSEGKEIAVSFTVPEGLTIYKTIDKLVEQGMGDKDKFIELVENADFDYEFLKTALEGKNRLEGYLLPNTYQIVEGASEEEVIKVMLDHFDKDVYKAIYLPMLNAEGDNMAKKYTLNEIVTMASIIERECGLVSEMKLVSSVIHNRLDISMPLQMDSTVEYIVNRKTTHLTYADMGVDSPYNTYKVAALPPGPICSPRAGAVDAALNPEKTKYIYFVLSAALDKSSVFFVDYNEFLKAKAAWKKASAGQ